VDGDVDIGWRIIFLWSINPTLVNIVVNG